MKRAAPWSIDGIKPDIREAAREAARRQGMTLSEWLNDIIAEQASDLDIDVDDLNSDERLEAVTARLHQLGGRESRYERPVRSRPVTRDDDDMSPRFGRSAAFRTDELEERRRMKRQGRSYERPYDRSHERDHLRVQDAEALLDAAIEAFDERASKSQRQAAQSVDAVTRLIKTHARQRDDSMEVLSDISNRLAEIETRMTRHAVDEACEQEDRNSNLDALPTVARRLADIESHLAKRSQDDSFRPIKGALSRLEARLDSLNHKNTPPPPDETGLKRLESKLDALLRNTAMISPDTSVRRPAAKTDWRNSLDSAVAEIGQQQRFLNGEAPDWRAAPQYADAPLINARINRSAPAPARMTDPHPLQSDIAALGVKLEAIKLQDLAKDLTRLRSEMGTMSAGLADLAPRDAVTSIESAIRNLTARIETSREEGMRETLLKPLTELADDLRHTLGSINPQPAIGSLEREIKAIGERLEALSKSPQEPEALARIQKQTQEIHSLLTSAGTHSVPLEHIERKVAALSEQIERHQSYAHLGPSEDDFISPRLQQTQADSLAKIEDRLNELTQKFEKAISVSSGTGSRMDPESLENVINVLADKLAKAQDPHAGAGAFEALQGQIAELAQRLERSDSGFSTLNSLQSSVGELFSRLDKTSFAANDSAEASARQAAREAVREVMEQTGLLAGNLPHDSGITREIADLRSVQDEADRQTHSTLNAVHETLEKIVDRLAMLEEEIGEAQEASAASFRLAEQNANANFERYGESRASIQAERPDAGTKKREPLLGETSSRGKKTRPEESAEYLIEPGTLFPKGKEAPGAKDGRAPLIDKAVEPEPSRNRADFIAAARRAAQAAQADQSQRETTRPRIPMADTKDNEPHFGFVAQTREFLSAHKRQLTLSIAALFLAVGAYAIVKTMVHTNADTSSNAPAAAVHSMIDTRAERKAEARADAPLAVAPAASPQMQQEAAPPRPDTSNNKADQPSVHSQASPSLSLPMMAAGTPSGVNPSAQKTIPGSDPIVVGSIVAPKGSAAPAPESQASLAALREQAEAGNAVAQYDLASRYAEGRSMARDLKLAADWYEKAAARGLAPAAYRLGSLYEKGLGVTRDFARAKSLYQKAAEQGHSHAMHNLAVLLAEGGDGKPDYAAASIWFRKAAEYGIRDSQYNLAILYARGLGVQQDLVQSYTWFAIAAAQGDEDAGKKREDVATRLDAKSLALAKAAVDVFHPREPDRASNEVQIPPGGWEASAPAPKVSARPKLSRL